MGDWQDGTMSGYGIMTWQDGRKYEGYFSNNKFSKEGKFTFKDGKIYEGGFMNGKKHGPGIIRF